MLRTKLFTSFALLILLLGVLSGWYAVTIIRTRVIDEAQSRVELDIGSAWSLYNAQLRELEIVMDMAAGKRTLVDACVHEDWGDPGGELMSRLEQVRAAYNLDFLTVVAPDGRVVMRTMHPHNRNDFRMHDPLVARALKGETVSATVLLSQSELEQEADGLGERAFMVFEETAKARPTTRTAETRGMVTMAAVPIWDGPRVYGVLYGGTLVNRNHDLVDRINHTLYGDRTYNGAPLGTATIFLHDCRIATTVRLPNNNRAIGTRASKEVADRVLDNAEPWIGRAFVVYDWYLTAYEPIRDVENRVIGILYVGILERPYRDLGRAVIWRYLGLTGGGVLVALGIAFVVAGRLADPIHRLVEASQTLQQGTYPEPVPECSAAVETNNLILAFNQMVQALREREQKLAEMNESLNATNQSYMETLGFVTHQMNTPVASMLNYAYLLETGASGPLTEKQEKAVRVINGNLRRLAEMIRHYLNLSRIERGELHPTRTRVRVLEDVLRPLIDGFEPQLTAQRMRVIVDIPGDVEVKADVNMMREVFENLLSNAIKYGRDEGEIRWSAERENGFYRFHVNNEGEGISPDKIDSLFGKFKRLEDAATQSKKGTGLGLFICKHIIEAHGGSIEADSQYGEWAEFRFTLPAFDAADERKGE